MLSISNKKNNKTICTKYKTEIKGLSLRVAVVADLHNSPWEDAERILRHEKPDIIVCPGDIFGSLLGECDQSNHNCARYKEEAAKNEVGFAFLREISSVAPVFFSIGNHEVGVSAENRMKLARTGAVLLDNSYTSIKNDILIGGLTSGGAHGLFHPTDPPDLEWLRRFAAKKGPKILLCHHPEYWTRFIQKLGIELTIAGHAHGGQWRFFGRGVLSPGQGFFPKYTSGVHKKGNSILVISRGLIPGGRIPRINNFPEVVILDIEG